ncbi:hypothetical protein S83_059758, partial [Arachis hypogaea]
YLLLFFSKLLIKQSRNQINVIRRKRNSAKKFLKRDTIDLLANHLQRKRENPNEPGLPTFTMYLCTIPYLLRLIYSMMSLIRFIVSSVAAMPFGSLVTTRKVSTWPPFSLRIKQTVHERILRIYDDFVWPLNLSSLASENKFLAVKLKQAANSIFPESNASSVNDYEVIQETLRSANILSFTFREVVEDVELQDYYIPKGWKVLPLFKAFTILLISSLNHTNSTPHAS